MIQLQVNPASIKLIDDKIHEKAHQIEFVASKTVMTEIAKAVFTITTNRFIKDLSAAAIQQPKKYHHLYEWNRVGDSAEKLFVMKRQTVQHGNLTIVIVPQKSTKPVPIDPMLLEPGSTGKVVYSRHIFREKMRVMEENNPIHYKTKNIVAFAGQTDIIFLPKGTIVDIMHPGGPDTHNALNNFADNWYNNIAPTVVESSGLADRIGTEVATVLRDSNSSISRVREAIRRVAASYSRELTEI